MAITPLKNTFYPLDVWQWKINSKSWITFSAGACRHLDAAVQHELKTTSFEDDKNYYNINMITKELVNNTSAKKGSARYISKEIAG